MSELHTIVKTRLESTGQRLTSGRLELLEILEQSDRPLTLPEVLALSEGLAQSSAYRNLTSLEDAGIVHRVVTSDDHARFELAEDLTGHHHHLVCSGCGIVIDFRLSNDTEGRLDAAFEEIAADTGFSLGHHRLDLIGSCADCQ